jgi:hypothetical protein
VVPRIRAGLWHDPGWADPKRDPAVCVSNDPKKITPKRKKKEQDASPKFYSAFYLENRVFFICILWRAESGAPEKSTEIGRNWPENGRILYIKHTVFGGIGGLRC